jgi:hypothetical protein
MPKRNEPIDVFQLIETRGPDECWNWKGRSISKDRPYFHLNGSKVVAYRVVFDLMNPEKLKPDEVVRHKCDNPMCCNPAHLERGTHVQNMQDMVDRDRHGLPKTVVRAIRRLLEEGRTHKAIADLYGVSRETVTAINNDRVHTHEEDYEASHDKE